MNRRLVFACSVLVALGSTLAAAASQEISATEATRDAAPDSTPDPPHGKTRAALEAHVATAIERGFSGVVLVFKDGEILLHQGYGLANRERDVQNDTETLFDIGSISKQFTRAAIIKLEELGKLKTSDPIGKHLADVPEDKVTITIDQVLDHEAGLTEYHDTQGDFERMDRIDAFRAIISRDLRFAPGTQRAYSNAGYTLLAMIVEETSGTSFQAFVRQWLLAPAGMAHTTWIGDANLDEARVAIGYGRQTFGDANSPAMWPEPTWALIGNGGMVSNASELHRWIVALRAGSVLSKDGVRKLHRMDSRSGEHFSYAGGTDFGFVAVVLEFADNADHLIITSNSDERTNAERELRALTRIAFDIPSQSRPQRAAAIAAGWGLPDSPTGRGCVALLNTIRTGTKTVAREFVGQLHPDWRAKTSDEELLQTVMALQETLAAPELEDARRKGPGQVEMVVRSKRSGSRFRVQLSVDPVAPHRVVGFDVQPEAGTSSDAATTPPGSGQVGQVKTTKR